MAGVDERRHRVYFTGNLDTPLERHLYWVDYRSSRRAAAGDRAGLVEQGGDGRGRDPRARHPLQPGPAAASLSRRRGRAAASPGSRRTGSMRRIPMRRSSPPMSRRVFGTLQRRRRHRAPLPDAVAAARARPALSGVRPGLWRAGRRAAGDPRLGSPIQQYLVQHGWIVFSLDNRGSPDRGKAFENAHLPCDGRRRGRRTSSPASPGCAARPMSIRTPSPSTAGPMAATWRCGCSRRRPAPSPRASPARR